MQQKLQATWCSDAVIFFATFFVVVCLFVCFCCFFLIQCYNAIRELCTTDTRIPVLNGEF